MFTTYDCEICGRSFKTNQHLTQHKNRKNKCKPAVNIEKPHIQPLQPPIPIPHPPLHSQLLADMSIPDTSNYSVSNIIQLVFSYKTSIDKINELEALVDQLRYEIKEKDILISNLRKMHPHRIYRFVNDSDIDIPARPGAPASTNAPSSTNASSSTNAPENTNAPESTNVPAKDTSIVSN